MTTIVTTPGMTTACRSSYVISTLGTLVAFSQYRQIGHEGTTVERFEAVRVKCAVRFCLAECCQSDIPLTYLSDFVAFLRQIGWSEQAVNVVEQQVLDELADVLPTLASSR